MSFRGYVLISGALFSVGAWYFIGKAVIWIWKLVGPA